ncbi:MAG: CidA/LrgA family protein [Burkholderiaceae bacterium]
MQAIRGFSWLLLLQTLGEVLARALHLPFPGPVIGMALLFLAMAWPALRADVAAVAGFLLEHLALLFVPVGVGVVAHLELLAGIGWRLLIVLLVSTWVGMAVTALALRAIWRAPDATGGGDG